MNGERKIVFFDVDGTIYERDRGTPESTRRALRLLRERGHIPVVCSGRPKASLFPEVLDLGFPAIIGGAGAYVEYEGKILRSILLSNDLMVRVIPKLEAAGCEVILEGPEYLSYNPQGKEVKRFGILNRLRTEYPERVKVQEPAADRASKITVQISDAAAFDALVPELSEDFELARYERIPVCEMMPKGVSKAEGIRVLTEYLGIPRCNTYAFGDGPNDMDMLQYVQYGTAVGNAEESLLRAARYRTESMWEDGIYLALERYGLIE